MVKLIKESNISAMKATGIGKYIKPRNISEKVELPDNWSEESKTLVKKAEAIAKEFFGKAWDGFTDKQQHDVIMGMIEQLGKLLDKENKKLQKESLYSVTDRSYYDAVAEEVANYMGYSVSEAHNELESDPQSIIDYLEDEEDYYNNRDLIRKIEKYFM